MSMTMINLKSAFVALAMTTAITSATVPQVKYSSYYEPNCTTLLTTGTIGTYGCFGVENWPVSSYTIYQTAGSCDEGQTLEMQFFGAANCVDLISTYGPIGKEASCVVADISPYSLNLTCV